LTLYFILALLCVSFNLYLISYISEEKRHGFKKRDIYFYLIFSTCWIVFDLLFKLGYKGIFSFVISRGTAIFWQLIPFIIMHLSYSVLGKKRDLLYNLFIFLVIISIFLTYSTYLVIDAPICINGICTSTYGPLHLTIIVFVVILPFTRILFLYFTRRKTLNRKVREQFFTILIGILSSFMVSLFIDVFIEHFFPDYTMPHVAALASVTFSICVFIAIKNYNFLGPELTDVLNSLFLDVDYDLIIVDSESNRLKTSWVLKKDIDDELFDTITKKIRKIRKKVFQEFSTIITKKSNKNLFFRMDFFPCYIENTFIGGLVFLKNITGDYHFLKDITESSFELEKIDNESFWELSKKTNKLTSSEKRFRDVLYNISEPIVVFDTKTGKISDVNKAFVELYKLDYLEENAIISDILNLGQKDDFKGFLEKLNQISKQNLIKQVDSKGKSFYIELLSFNVSDKTTLLIKDYTNIIEFENALIRKERIAISALVAGSFVSEFKKMHKKINILLDDVLEKNSSDKGLHDLLKRVQNASLKSEKILNQLNTFSSLEINPSLVNISKIVREELSDLEGFLIQNKINISKDLDENIMLECDADAIAIVIKNLIINSVHALHKIEDPWLIVKVGIMGNLFYFSVKDNVIGIKEDEKTKIFRPFYTNKNFDKGIFKSDIEGTGLGLSVCEMIVRKHNGKIEVESEYGKGSEFLVWLPV